MLPFLIQFKLVTAKIQTRYQAMPKTIIKITIFLAVALVAYSVISPDSSATTTSSNGNVISVSNSDTITYKSGYYLVGSDWKPFTLSGSLFPGFNQWILDGASASIDITNDRATIGNTAYILTYGCNLNSTNTQWVCGDNGNWQITEVSIPQTPPPPGENKPPTVSLTGPANGASFILGSNINLSANASDLDGTVSKVEFLVGG